MHFLQILPLAFVMIAGPQIITSFFLATGERYAANSAAYIGGAAIAVTGYVTAAFLVAHFAKNAGHHTTNKVLDWIVWGAYIQFRPLVPMQASNLGRESGLIYRRA